MDGRTRIKNAIHALLIRENISILSSDIFGKVGMEYLLKLELPPQRRFALDGYLEVLKTLTEEIKKAEEKIKERVGKYHKAWEDHQAGIKMAQVGFRGGSHLCFRKTWFPA